MSVVAMPAVRPVEALRDVGAPRVPTTSKRAPGGPYDGSLVLDHLQTAYALLLGVTPGEYDADTALLVSCHLDMLATEAHTLDRRARARRGWR